MRTPTVAAALSLAGAISLASLPVQAAPLTSLSAAAKPAAQTSDAIQVRWGGWHGGAFGFGIGALAAGLIGAAIASPYYYGGYPYYGGSYYGGPYYNYGYYGYPYSRGFSTAYYPAYSYPYYRPYRRVAFGYRYHRPYRHFYVAHRPFWRHSFATFGVHHYRHHHWR